MFAKDPVIQQILNTRLEDYQPRNLAPTVFEDL